MSSVVRQAPVADHHERINDLKRLGTLAATGLLDADAEEAFDRFTKLAARWLGVPTALISLVDDHRQFFKSAVGLGEPWATKRETPLSHSFCQYAVSSREPLIVADARMHPWLHENLAVSELQVVAYAGVPLITSDEQALGALCVIDVQPRAWTEEEIAVLRDLAALTMTEIELRGQLARLNALRAERGKERVLLHSVLDSIDDAITVTGTDGKLMLTNPAARRTVAVESFKSVTDLGSVGIFEGDGNTPLQAPAAPTMRALGGEEVRDVVIRIQGPGEDARFLAVNASPLRHANGAVFAAVSVGRNVTAARIAQQALARSESILQGVVRNLPNCAVLLFDHDLRYLMADGDELLNGIGYTREALVGKTLYQIASPQGVAAAEARYRAALAGETISFEVARGEKIFAVTTVPVRDAAGVVTGGLALIYDVTAHKRAEALIRREAEEVRSQALRDELTGLYNRRGFLQLSRQQLAIAEQMQRPALLFFVDLNGMKQINDQLGHEEGDHALVEIADVLRTTFRGSDVIARLGGDEFVALLMDGDERQLAFFTERVQREIESHNQQPNRAYRLSASIGGSAFDPGAPQTIDALLAKADALMYEQKKARNAAGPSIPPTRS